MLFVQQSNWPGAKQMLEWKASLNTEDCLGRTPFHFLAQADATGRFTEWLLKEDAILASYNINERINALTTAGVSPLMLAVKLNNPKVVEHLLNAGANPFLKDQLGQEAINYKVTLIHTDTKCNSIEEMLNGAKMQWLEQVD